MSHIQSQVMTFAKKASKPYKYQNLKGIQPSDVIAVDRSIAPKIRQNERERAASVEAAAKCIVGGK